MSFEDIIVDMTTQDTPNIEDIIVIDRKLTRSVFKINTKLICFSECSGRCFFYIQGLSDLKKFIPDINEDGVLLLIVVTDMFDMKSFATSDCTHFIKDFNTMDHDKYSFVHDYKGCTPSGIGFTELQDHIFIPRAGTKPKRSTLNKPFFRLSKRKNTFHMTVDSLWLKLSNDRHYELKETQFIMKFIE